MFDSFQFHPRSTKTTGQLDFGTHFVFATDEKGPLHRCLAQDKSFSKPFKGDNLNAASTAALEIKYDTLRPTLCLSPREKEVLLWAGRGKSAWETAQLLGLSEATIKYYVRNACTRLGVKNKTHAVAICLTHGLFRI